MRPRSKNLDKPAACGESTIACRFLPCGCDFFKVTATTGEGTGEGLWQIPAQRGEYLIADRGYSNNVGMVPVAKVGAYLTVRLNQGSVLLQDANGRRLELLPKLQRLTKPGQVGSWKVFWRMRSGPVAGRVCAIRKTRTAIEQAHRKLERSQKTNRGQSIPKPWSTPGRSELLILRVERPGRVCPAAVVS